MPSRPEDTAVHLLRQTRGGMVNHPDLALAIARQLLLYHYSAEDLARSEPLAITDEKTAWKVEGTPFRAEEWKGIQRAVVKIEKNDGRIAELVIEHAPDLPPDVKEALIAARNRSKSR